MPHCLRVFAFKCDILSRPGMNHRPNLEPKGLSNVF